MLTRRQLQSLLRRRTRTRGHFLELANFRRAELSKLSRAKAVHVDAGIARAVEAQHHVPNGGTQTLDQMRAAFSDHQLEPGVALGGLVEVHRQGSGHSVFQTDAPAQFLQSSGIRRAFDFGQVHARHLEAGMGELVGQGAVVREE